MKEIVLSNKPAVAQGSIRDVYRHPANPRLLVKVVRLSTLDEKYGSGRRWFKSRKRRYGHLIGYLREVREQLALQAAAKEHPRYLRKIVGFAETDLGPGLVVEAVFAPNGSYAPTLGTLLKDGPLSPKLEGAFDRFCEEVVRSPLILSEMNIDNVVFGSTGDGDQRFVLIDGIGHKKFIPLEVRKPRAQPVELAAQDQEFAPPRRLKLQLAGRRQRPRRLAWRRQRAHRTSRLLRGALKVWARELCYNQAETTP
jgi:PhoP regulatory network protein YrbL